MADQNPMYRDRGRREDNEQQYEDARERYAENEAEIGNRAPRRGARRVELTDEEKRELEEAAAERRFDEIGREVRDEHDASGGSDDGH